MPESDPFRVLVRHDRWATGQVLEACGRLPEAQFGQRFEIGPGSLHDTLTHIIGTIRSLTETLGGREARPRLEADGQTRTPGELQLLLEESWQGLLAEIGRRPVEEMVTRRTKDGRELRMTRGAMLAHLMVHGTHHRAQCLNMLRQLGVKPLPASSVAEWTWAGER